MHNCEVLSSETSRRLEKSHATSHELQRIYSRRFSGLEDYRDRVWRILTAKFFSQYTNPEDTILDLGCGYGEFINNINAGKKLAMDLNPTAGGRVADDVELIQQDCSSCWPLADGCLDVVFTSNFFEHLPSKAALQATLREAYRCLRPGGKLMALGPNVRYLSGEYWDFFDHHIALTELSLSEALQMAGFDIEQAIAKFLPYTMSQGFKPPMWAVSVYLSLRPMWKLSGKQFFVVGRKPRAVGI